MIGVLCASIIVYNRIHYLLQFQYQSLVENIDRSHDWRTPRDQNAKTSALHRCSVRTAVSRERAARAPAALAASVGKTHTEIRVCTCMCIHCIRTPRRCARTETHTCTPHWLCALPIGWLSRVGSRSNRLPPALPMQPRTCTTCRRSGSVRMQRAASWPFRARSRDSRLIRRDL